MKILELRFKNLNSLYGEWVIDFTNPEYVSNGIFSLTGPTGAGKSTILDAICLALYGATPRLGKISKSGNEIMSRQTGECYAEVLFESQAGRFRSHWEQRRARKRAAGNLQDQEHQIADGDTGKPIETKKSLVSGVIEEKTGMDFDRFTRSILLAQGGFDTFLKADAEQKSKILEQITGTEIYSAISRRVHERQREEREKLNLLQAQTAGIVILEPEQEQEIRHELKTKQQEETDLTTRSVETARAIAWLTAIDRLKKEISSLSNEDVRLQREITAFKPERDRLGLAIKAASLDGSHAMLTAIRKQQSDDQASLKAEGEALPELQSSVREKAESLNSSEEETVKTKMELKAAAPLIFKVRSLDQKIAEQKNTVSEAEEDCKKDTATVDSDRRARLNELEKLTEASKNLERAESYLREHAEDEWLISGLAGVEEQLNRVVFKQQEMAQQEADHKMADGALDEAAKKHDLCRVQWAIHKQELDDASQNLRRENEAFSELLGGRLLREYRAEKDTLLREMVFLAKIAELEDHREKLEDGQPCPLCGSKVHPYAEDNVPLPDDTENEIEALTKLISKAEDQDAVIKKLEKVVTAAGKTLTESEKLEASAASDKKDAEKALAVLNDSLGKIQTEFSELKKSVSAKLQILGIAGINDEVSSLLESLRKRLSAWQVQVREKADAEKRIAGLDSELKRLEAVIETQNNALSEKQRRLQALIKEHRAVIDERQKLYGDKRPDEVERRLNSAVNDAEEAEKKLRARYSQLQQKLTTAETRIESLQKRIDQREEELERAEADFRDALHSTGFLSEKQFLDARLAVEQRDTLSAKAKELDDSLTDLTARQKDRQTRLAIESAQKLTDTPPEQLELQFKEHENSLQQLRNALAGLKHALKENSAAQMRMRDMQHAIEAQKKECRRWEKLHGLIGSADGKKYRNFAQGLTFELMVSHANRQLIGMTDRYLLIRDDERPLELNVIDNYQAGEIRSTRNLSGGESFIVSLTLALGLSKMASRKVRVDSLFLDEGFGTLDEEALESALETLSGLQQDGKLIGIISHVPALKDRVSTQITVTPTSGGKSTLTGPGCSKVRQNVIT